MTISIELPVGDGAGGRDHHDDERGCRNEGRERAPQPPESNHALLQ
jgi:hypothetical protein